MLAIIVVKVKILRLGILILDVHVMALFSYTGTLSRKLANLATQLEKEARELSESLARADFNANHVDPKKKLKDFSKVLDEVAFIRTELILAGERRKRRTM